MAETFDLNGDWKVNYIKDCEDIDTILKESYIPEGWLKAQVPEDIHATLRREGLRRGHLYGKDPKEDLWIEERDWVYYKHFYFSDELNGKQVKLNFEGIDTICDIYLNGRLIGSGNNMFVPLGMDVSDQLKYQQRNVLVVHIKSAVNHVRDMDYNQLFSHMTYDRIPVRKAQMNYRWDFCERIVGAGIWKDVYLTGIDEAYIESYYVFTESLDKQEAVVGVEIQLAIPEYDGVFKTGVDYRYEASLWSEGVKHTGVAGTIDGMNDQAIMTIGNPNLWWPRPYGEPFLYEFRLEVFSEGRLIDRIRQPFGIRTVEIQQKEQEDGRSFTFVINHKPIFIRGANWVPLDVIYTDIEEDMYDKLMHYAINGNISMLRIWGGGIYESERMFQLCDQYGIMIWNDFMFACGIYPQDSAYLDNVYSEAEHNIKKYRNYTSLVIWAGSNEDDQAYGWAGRGDEFLEDKVSRITLQKACDTFDPHRLYIPSSPYNPDTSYMDAWEPNSDRQGDMHVYIFSSNPESANHPNRDHQYYKNIRRYRPRFMSEFGFISLPEKESYYRYNFLKKQLVNDELIKICIPFFERIQEKGDHDQAVYYTQLYNALAFKDWIEYFRSLKWTCSGSLYWKFNDPLADTEYEDGLFPSMMSVIDMYQRPRMTYYYTKRAYEDVILVCSETEESYRIYGISELDCDWSGELKIFHMDYDGKILNQSRCEATIIGDASTCLYELKKTELNINDHLNEYLKIVFDDGNHLVSNRHLFADIIDSYDIKTKPQEVEVLVADRTREVIRVHLKVTSFARNVRLNIPDCLVTYTDNYFDMDAHEVKEVEMMVEDTDSLMDSVIFIEGEKLERTVIAIADLVRK